MYFTRQSKRSFWSDIIQEWESGDESQATFCDRKGIKFSSFSSWRQQLKKPSKEEDESPRQKFVEAQVADDPARPDERCIAFTLSLKNGFVMTVPACCTTSQLQTLFTALGVRP